MGRIKSGLLKIDKFFFKGKIKAYHSRNFKYKGKAYKLTKDLYFPPHASANKNVRLGPEGELLAIGGDLSMDRMIYAFKNGIYPMFFKDEPILWWTSDSHCVVFLENLHIGRDVKKFIKQENYRLTADNAFYDVVEACSELRKGLTWLTPERKEAVYKLHRLGLAHSVEVWQDEQMIGGLYGILFGSYFYPESMFTRMNHGSKVAFTALSLRLKEMNFSMIDLGIWPTDNLKRYGAVTINRDDYLELLNESLNSANIVAKWGDLFENWDFKSAIEKYLTDQSKINKT